MKSAFTPEIPKLRYQPRVDPDMRSDFSLEELGLLHLLERIERGTQVIDSIVRHGLIKQGLILAGEQLKLSDEGRRTVATLKAAREELETANVAVVDARRTTGRERRRGGLITHTEVAEG